MKFLTLEKLANKVTYPHFLHNLLLKMQFQDVESIAEQISHPHYRKINFINYVKNKSNVMNDLLDGLLTKDLFFMRYKEFFGCEPNLISPFKHIQTGDLVTYTNHHGESFANHRILSFFEKPNGEVYLFLDIPECFTPVSITEITQQKGYLGLDRAQDLKTLQILYQHNRPLLESKMFQKIKLSCSLA